jgi:hypothetical protein
MNKFGVTKPNKAHRRALEGTIHAPKKKRSPEDSYKEALSSTSHALKHQKDATKKRHLQDAHNSLVRAGQEKEDAVKEMALRRA